MNAPFSPRRPFEMFDYIGHISVLSLDAAFFECAIKNFSRRPNKGPAGEIFRVSWLFAHQHDLGARRALTENGLRGTLPQRASLATGGKLAKLLDCGVGIGIGGRVWRVDVLARSLFKSGHSGA